MPDTVTVVPYERGQLILPTGYNPQAGVRINPRSGIQPGQAVQYGENIFVVGINGQLTRTMVNIHGQVIGEGPIIPRNPRNYSEKGSASNANNPKAPPVPSIYDTSGVNTPENNQIKVSSYGSLTGGGKYQNDTGRYPTGTKQGVYGPAQNPIIVQQGRGSSADAVAAYNKNNQTYNDPGYYARQRDIRNREAQRQANLGLANYQDKKGNTYNIKYQLQEQNGSGRIRSSDRLPFSSDSNRTNNSSVNKAFQGTLTEAPQEPITIFGYETGLKFGEGRPTSSQLSAKSLQYRDVDNALSAQYGVEAFGVGFLTGSYRIVFQPINTIKGLFSPFIHPVQFAKSFKGQLETNPEGTFGEIVATQAAFAGVKTFIPSSPFTRESVVLDTTRGPVSVESYGFQVGSRGVRLYSKVTEPSPLGPIPGESPILLLNPLADVRNTGVQGTLLNLKPTPSTLTLGELRGPIPTPETVALSKTVYETLNLEPNLLQRTKLAARTSELLLKDTGRIIPPEQVFFPVGDIPTEQQISFSGVTERFAGQNDAFFFGSGTTQQLPELFQGKQIGDVDVIFTKASKQQIGEVLLPKLLKDYEGVGITGLEQSPKNPLVIQFPTGEKIIEAKSLFDIQPGDDIALAGFYGVKFPNLKKGGRPATVPFGLARAITAGEQGARKGAASSFINPAFSEGPSGELPSAFQKGGVYGRTGGSQPRVLKDPAGFVQSEQGLLALRGEQNVFKRFIQFRSTTKAQSALNSYLGTFTSAERLGITNQLAKQIGEGGRSEGVIFTPETSATLKSFLSDREASSSPGFSLKNPAGFGSPSLSPGRPVIQSRVVSSPSASSSPGSRYSLSRFASPNLSPSPVISRIFAGSPSPNVSPRRSPSPAFSPASSPSRSPSRSPGSSPSSLFSPSPSPSNSPSPRFSPGRSSSPSPSRSSSPSPFGSGRSPFSNSISFPKSSPPFKIPSGDKKKDFEVYIRRFGKFSLLGSSLTKESAIGLGRFSVERSLGATFKVTEGGAALSFGDLGAGLVENFRPGKNQKEFVIQKREKRLSSTEERIAIQRARKIKGEVFL